MTEPPQQGVADFPAAIFAEELIQAYPEAHIVLSTRPEDAWYASMLSTLWHQRSVRLRTASSTSSGMASLAAKYHTHCWGDDFPARGRECFRRHNELVRRLGEKAAEEDSGGRRFLEYDVKQGWGPLCAFLGVAVPEGPMPRKDDWAEYKRKVEEEKEAAAAAAGDAGS